MVKYCEAVRALKRVANPSDEMIRPCREQLVRSKARRAVRGDYWAWYSVYFQLSKAVLMTFDLITSDHPKYYSFTSEISPYIRKCLPDETKRNVINALGQKWQKRGAQPVVLNKIVEWGAACYALDDKSIVPDPKPVPVPVPVPVRAPFQV